MCEYNVLILHTVSCPTSIRSTLQTNNSVFQHCYPSGCTFFSSLPIGRLLLASIGSGLQIRFVFLQIIVERNAAFLSLATTPWLDVIVQFIRTIRCYFLSLVFWYQFILLNVTQEHLISSHGKSIPL